MPEFKCLFLNVCAHVSNCGGGDGSGSGDHMRPIISLSLSSCAVGIKQEEDNRPSLFYYLFKKKKEKKI